MNSAARQFWDTSAAVALILDEKHTGSAMEAKNQALRAVAWSWLRIEAESALLRRQAAPHQFERLATLLKEFEYVSLDEGDFPDLRMLLRAHRLRTADAAHLLCLQRAAKIMSGIQFVCFDDELCRAAKKEGIPVFSHR